MAAPLINLPAIVTMALSASLVPAISEAVALKNYRLAAARAETGVRVSIILGLPATVGIYVLAEPICSLLYQNPEVGVSLAALSWGVLFLAITQTTTGILQGIGKTLIPVRNMLIGAVGKVVINYVFTGIPEVNIKGAAYGSVVGYMLPAILNFYAVAKFTGLSLDFGPMIIRPALATLLMGLAVTFGYGELLALGLGGKKATLVAIALGILTYPVLLLILGGVKREDLELLPGGHKLIKFLNRFGAMRR
jgi:stage V sporulation protein B